METVRAQSNHVRIVRSPVKGCSSAVDAQDVHVSKPGSRASPTAAATAAGSAAAGGKQSSRRFMMGLLESFLDKRGDRSPTKFLPQTEQHSTDTLFCGDAASVSAPGPAVPRPLAPLELLSLPAKPTGLISGPTPLLVQQQQQQQQGGKAVDVEKQIGHYEIRKVLGQGTFGKVKLAVDMYTNETVAIKIIDKKSIKTSKQRISVDRELRLMKLLHHEHIVAVLDVLETDAHYFVVMEHAAGGELFDYIIKSGRLPEAESRKFFRQLVSAMDYCHKNSVLHRDLKPENLLLDSAKNIKIIDFGFGNTFHKDRLLDTFCGSPFYAAPEMIQGIKYTGPEVDVWSMGVILYALLSGKLPFDAPTMTELYQKIAKGHYHVPSYFSAEAKDLLSRMLDVNRYRRYTLDQVLAHPWVLGAERAAVPRLPCSWLETTPTAHADSIAELVSYGFNADDARRMLASETASHPIVSLYHLVEKARVRRELKWQSQCNFVKTENARRTAAWEQRRRYAERLAEMSSLGNSADTILGNDSDAADTEGHRYTLGHGLYSDLDAPLDPRLAGNSNTNGHTERAPPSQSVSPAEHSITGGLLSFLKQQSRRSSPTRQLA